KVQVEILDPATDPEKENEANQVYGIRPTPFQVTGRYETAIVNAYFDILIRYGDQSATLGFRDLIEVKERPDGTVDVGLRNLEYDLTSAIKKTVYGFQSVDTALASFEAPAELTFFVTPNALPSTMAEALEAVRRVAQEIAAKAPDKLVYREVDPTAPSSGMTPQQLAEEYGIQPFAASLFSDQTYYFHLILKAPQKTQAENLTSE
ncbi:MAG: Gldg family protein, partial [Chloroflexi bacterium]|nr:Gldg family protein [Chloroflexota bacterium]